jgi:hypothetical protein
VRSESGATDSDYAEGGPGSEGEEDMKRKVEDSRKAPNVRLKPRYRRDEDEVAGLRTTGVYLILHTRTYTYQNYEDSEVLLFPLLLPPSNIFRPACFAR